MELTVYEKETLCDLDLKSNRDALERQRNYALELSRLYETGAETAPRDKWKAAKFREKAGEFALELNHLYGTGTKFKEDGELNNPNPPGSSLLRTKNIYYGFGKYTFTRLYILRVNFLADFFYRSFLPRLFSIAGFSYAAELLFDVGVVLYSTFRPSPVPIGTRFLNVLLKDGRPSRMLNAAVWFSLNLTCFIVTGGLSTILTLGGFGFDILHESGKWKFVHQRNQNYFKKISNELETKNKALLQMEIEQDLLKSKMLPLESSQLDQINSLKREIKELECIKTQLDKKVKSDEFKSRYHFFCSTLVLTGMALCFLPPTMIFGVALTTVGLMLDTEGLFHEQLKKGFNKIRNYLSSSLGLFTHKSSTLSTEHITKNQCSSKPESSHHKVLRIINSPKEKSNLLPNTTQTQNSHPTPYMKNNMINMRRKKEVPAYNASISDKTAYQFSGSRP